jgi:hypothetical protein
MLQFGVPLSTNRHYNQILENEGRCLWDLKMNIAAIWALAHFLFVLCTPHTHTPMAGTGGKKSHREEPECVWHMVAKVFVQLSF